jgi:hypothetical protein
MNDDINKRMDMLEKRVFNLEYQVTLLLKRGTTSPGVSRSIMDLKDIMEAKERQVEVLKAYRYQVAGGEFKWTNEKARVKHGQIRKEIRELNNRIAGMQ